MNEGLIARRYAKALFKYAGEKEDQLLLYQRMKLFQENCVKHPELQKVLRNPMLTQEVKERVLSTALDFTSPQTERYRRAIHLLIRNHRERYIKSIAWVYQKIFREAYHIEQVKVTTAVPLTKEMEREIQAMAKKHTTKSLEYTYHVDPSIIGGFILEIGSEQLDTSVIRELKKIHTDFLS